MTKKDKEQNEDLSPKQQETEAFRNRILQLLNEEGELSAYNMAKIMLRDDEHTLHSAFVSLNVKLGRNLKALKDKGIVAFELKPSDYPGKNKKVWRIVK
jgi:hypothetical protein